MDVSPSDEPYQIDPRNGNLVIRHRDLSLPGNGGMNIEVWRVYSLNQVSSGLASTHNQSFRWTALGPGWTLGAAPKITAANLYNPKPSNSPGMPPTYASVLIGNSIIDLCLGKAVGGGQSIYNVTLELPSGETEPIYSNGGTRGITPGNWKVDCVANNISATSPAGTVYQFGTLTTDMRFGQAIAATPGISPPVYLPPPMPTVAYLVAKSATDVNGNSLAYQYQTFGTPITLPNPLNAYGPLPSGIGTPSVSDVAEKPSTLLSSITSSDGRSVSFSYDASTGRLQSMSDNAGRTVTYTYLAPDSNNSRTLSSVSLPGGMTWAYNYNPGPFATSSGPVAPLDQTAASRKLSKIIYPTGGSVTFNYGYWFLTQPITNSPTSMSSGERVVRKTLSTGESWAYVFTPGGTGQYDTTTITGPEGTTTYKFMGAGYIKSTDSNTVYHNNAWRIGRLMQKIDPLGNTETYSWQQRLLVDRPTSIFDLGYVRDEKIWNAELQSRVITRDGATYSSTYSNIDSYGNPGLTTENGPNGGSRATTTTYVNDTSKWIIGRPKDQSATGMAITRNFDANGNLLSETTDGIATTYSYDGQGNIATKTFPRGLVHSYGNYKRGIAQTESQPEGINISRTVDNAGNITSTTDGEGKTVAFAFDGLNRLTSITPPVGNPTSIVYTPNSKTSTRGQLVEATQYDGFGRAVSINLGGISTTFAFDGFGRKTFESYPGSSSGTSFVYDAISRKTKIINADNTVRTFSFGPGTVAETDERGFSSTYSYRSYGDPQKRYLMSIASPVSASNVAITRNARDQVATISQNGQVRTYGYNASYYLTSVANPETGTTTYGRDAAGNMTSRAVGASGTTNYVYDNQNRLTSATYPGSTPSVVYSYYRNNKMASASSSTENRQFAYDDNGNLKSETATIDGIVFAAGYSYNGNDQLSSITYPISGRVVSYAPDVLGRPTQASGYVNSVSYWPSGQMMQVIYANGTSSNYSQNTRLWPAGFDTQGPGGTYLSSTYGYDEVGNLTSVTDAVDSSFNRALGYDGIGRITSAQGAWGSGSIAYDGSNNIMSQAFGGASLYYNYDSSNRLGSISGIKSSSYGYDAYGNITSDGNNTFVYDGVPNLRCANCSSGTRADYTYDALGRRNSIMRGGVKSYEITGSNNNMLLEYAPTQGGKLTEYIYIGNKRMAERVSP